jgi:2,3-bisphosphoglycerate-dependent phosphoglycerate mutase
MARDFQQPFSLPDGAVEVILVRHGSAPHAAGGPVIDGSSDPDLSELGRRQADAVARRLGGQRLDGLFVTTLRRTHQTVAPLAAALAMTPVVVPELREVGLGDWEGRLQERVAANDELIAKLFRAGRWDVIPGAESMDAFAERVAAGLALLADSGTDSRVVLAVVHGGVIAEACRQVTESHPFAFLRAENCSITRLMRTLNGRWELNCFNDTAHLNGVIAAAPPAGARLAAR